jgi:hypothetical protein
VGTGVIWLNDVGCDGTENRLIDCPASTLVFGQHNCSHSQDAGVRCGMNEVVYWGWGVAGA